jgi:hypothetical protein
VSRKYRPKEQIRSSLLGLLILERWAPVSVKTQYFLNSKCHCFYWFAVKEPLFLPKNLGIAIQIWPCKGNQFEKQRGKQYSDVQYGVNLYKPGLDSPYVGQTKTDIPICVHMDRGSKSYTITAEQSRKFFELAWTDHCQWHQLWSVFWYRQGLLPFLFLKAPSDLGAKISKKPSLKGKQLFAREARVT